MKDNFQQSWNDLHAALRYLAENRRLPLAQVVYNLAWDYVQAFEGVYDHSFRGELMVLDRLRDLWGPDECGLFLDVGALYGDWSRFVLERFPKASIIAVEMDHRAVAELKDNLPGQEVIHAALLDEEGTTYYWSYSRPEISSLYKYSYTRENPTQLKVTALTASRLLAERNVKHVRYVKIDAEGSDYAVLKGFADFFKQGGKVDVFQFEYGPICIEARVLLKDFYDYLQSLGYIIGKIYFPEGVLFRPYSYDLENFFRGNYIAAYGRDLALVRALSVQT